MLNRLTSYLRESRQELYRVNWPSRKETTRLTLVVIVFSLLVAGYLGILDNLFSYLLGIFLI